MNFCYTMGKAVKDKVQRLELNGQESRFLYIELGVSIDSLDAEIEKERQSTYKGMSVTNRATWLIKQRDTMQAIREKVIHTPYV